MKNLDALFIWDFHPKNSFQTNSPSLLKILSLKCLSPYLLFSIEASTTLSSRRRQSLQPCKASSSFPELPTTTRTFVFFTITARSFSFSLLGLHLVCHHLPVVLTCNTYTEFILPPTDTNCSNFDQGRLQLKLQASPSGVAQLSALGQKSLKTVACTTMHSRLLPLPTFWFLL